MPRAYIHHGLQALLVFCSFRLFLLFRHECRAANPAGVAETEILDSDVGTKSRSMYVEALSCLNVGWSQEHLATDNLNAVALYKKNIKAGIKEKDAMPGPRVVRIPLAHGSVYNGNWHPDSLKRKKETNCIEKAWRFVVVEKKLAQLEAAENLAAFLRNTTKQMPLNFFEEPESIRTAGNELLQKALQVTDRKSSRQSNDIKRLVNELHVLYNDYQKLRSRSGLDPLFDRASTLMTSIASKVSNTKKKLESTDYFGADSTCAPFSEVSTRMARFLWCLGGSHLQTKTRREDGRVEAFLDGRGVYSGRELKWVLMSRIATIAVRYPGSWQREALVRLQPKDSNEVELASCAQELLPRNASRDASIAQARSLGCLPALINAPGFSGVVREEKGRETEQIVVDQQCVISPVCGRLGAAVLTVWQARTHSMSSSVKWNLGSWTEGKDGNPEHTGCTSPSRDDGYVCYDYSDRCFPEVMKFMCYMLPDCCPSKYDYNGNRTHLCSALGVDGFIKDNRECDVCIRQSIVFSNNTINEISAFGLGALRRAAEVLLT